MMTPHRYLFDEHVHSFYPTLATRIGLNEAVVLQQIHSWIQTYTKDPKQFTAKHWHDDQWWIWNSYPEWHDKLPYLSESTIRRALVHMRKLGILKTGNYNTLKIDRTYWYAIDYAAYDALMADQDTKVDAPSYQNGQMQDTNLVRPLPSISPSTSASKEEPPLADSPLDPFRYDAYTEKSLDTLDRAAQQFEAAHEMALMTTFDCATNALDRAFHRGEFPELRDEWIAVKEKMLQLKADSPPGEDSQDADSFIPNWAPRTGSRDNMSTADADDISRDGILLPGEPPQDPTFWPEGETPPEPPPQEAPEKRIERLRDELGTDPLQVASVVEKNRAREAHPDGGDPSRDGDPWVDIAVKEWARISGKDFKGMSIGTKLLLAGIFRKVGAIAESGAVPVAAAIGRFPGEHKWWAEKVGFEWPSGNFCNKLGMMLVPDVEPEPQREFTFVDPDWLGVST